MRQSETDTTAVQEMGKTQENDFMDGVFADGCHRVIKQRKVKNNAGETPPKTFRGELSHHSHPLKANPSVSCPQCAPPYLHLHAFNCAPATVTRLSLPRTWIYPSPKGQKVGKAKE